MAGMFSQMGPMYENMMQAMIEGTLKVYETREEALQIVAGAGIAGMRTGK